MNLNAKNLDIAVLAASEAGRFSWNSILVSGKGTVVTDDHCLVRVSLPEQFPAESVPAVPGFTYAEEPKDFMLAKVAALSIAKAIPKSGDIPMLNNVFVGQASEHNLCLMTTDLKSPQVHAPMRQTGSFPDYERVIPRTEDAQFTIEVDLNILLPVLQQAAKLLKGERVGKVVFRFTKPNSAIRIDCECDPQTFTAIVMPLKSERQEARGEAAEAGAERES